MNRRTFNRNLLLATVVAPTISTLFAPDQLLAAQAVAQQKRSALCHRSLTEYKLPSAKETHEIVKVPNAPLILISQFSKSQLVKLWLDPKTEQITGIKAFPLGFPDAMVHGLAVSYRYPGMIWATVEGENKLLLIDPGRRGLTVPPKVLRVIPIPGGGRGPHYVGEYGDSLWVTLKASNQVLAINYSNPKSYRLYQTLPNPIFIARHPISGEFYVSEDMSSQLLRINPITQKTSQIAIPPTVGQKPVGLIAGPLGLWVVLLGTAEQGTGTFGRIDAQGNIHWFQLTSPEGHNAGLLHIAFDSSASKSQPHAWLLSSSIISPNVLDMIIRVTFNQTYTQLTREEIAVLPTRSNKAHRLLTLPHSVFATELATSTLAKLSNTPGCFWNQPLNATPGTV